MNRRSNELENWIRKLRDSNKVIIVEGKNDMEALNSLGISNIISLNRRPIYKVVEEIAQRWKKAIILTDLDKEGKKLYGNLSSSLQRLGVEIDNYFREFLLKKTKLRQIEGFNRYIKNINKNQKI